MVPNRARELRHVLALPAKLPPEDHSLTVMVLNRAREQADRAHSAGRARESLCENHRIDRSLWSRLGSAVMRLIVALTQSAELCASCGTCSRFQRNRRRSRDK
jgi:hypothetical protein